MAQLPGGGFNANDHGEMRHFEVLPKDDYLMQIVASDMVATKDKTGAYLALEIEVLTPEFAGRKLYQNLNLNNTSAKAVEIANNELATICRVTRKPVIQDSVELHLIPFIGEVDIEAGREAVAATATTKARKAYPPRNKITGYRPADDRAIPQGAAKPAPVIDDDDDDDPTPEPAATKKPAAAAADDVSGSKPPWA